MASSSRLLPLRTPTRGDAYACHRPRSSHTQHPVSARLSPAELGRQGEAFAAAYFRERGTVIVETNASFRGGEIDLVAIDPDGDVVFVEVKTRMSREFGAAEAVNSTKLNRIRRAAASWLEEHRVLAPVRIDVLSLTVVDVLPLGDDIGHILFDADHYMGVESGAN